jgi:hypothetical protein
VVASLSELANRAAVTRIAGRLLQVKTMSGDEARALFGEATPP